MSGRRKASAKVRACRWLSGREESRPPSAFRWRLSEDRITGAFMMTRRLSFALSGGILAMVMSTAGWAGVFGRVVPIGGQASDIALDEARGVLYIANFPANRIEVM